MNPIIADLLMEAYYSEDLEKVRIYLSKGANVNERLRSSYGMTLIHRSPSLAITKLLLSSGANVNALDNKSRTPLHYAVIYDKPLSEVRELLSCGANVNAVDDDGQTPLHHCILLTRKLTMIQELLLNGANSNLKDKKQLSPLHLAVGYGNGMDLKVIMELLEFGAEFDVFNNESDITPLDIAVQMGYVDCAKLILKISIIKHYESYIHKIHILDQYIDSAHYEELSHYLYDCSCEMIQMRTQKINRRDTLHTFISNYNVLSHFFLINAIDEKIIETNYVIYKDLILPKIKLYWKRIDLINKLKELYISLQGTRFNNILPLNYDCIYGIAKYLDNEDLCNFLSAFDNLCL